MKYETPRRVWVNQPSRSQPFHHLHGQCGLAVNEYPGTDRFFFLSGNKTDQQIFTIALSEGWPEHLSVLDDEAYELETLEEKDYALNTIICRNNGMVGGVSC